MVRIRQLKIFSWWLKQFHYGGKKYALAMIVIWTVLVAASLLWNVYNARVDNLEKARIEAGTLFEMTLAYRNWSTLHGGVYVPVTPAFQPNPYLTVPERDVTVRTGEKLTLVNPAWMTQQVFALLSTSPTQPIINHITSLKYLDPRNKPDAWEEQALRAFERQGGERSETLSIGNLPYLRMMWPLVTEPDCLKCHARQGYKAGDIRGGISIAVPLQPYFKHESAERTTMAMTHGFLWLFGLGGIFAFTGWVRRKEEEIGRSEEKYRLLFENNPHPMWVSDVETLEFLMVNDAAVRHYGYSRQEFLSMTVKDIRPPEDVPAFLNNVVRLSASGGGSAGIWRHRKKDGTVIYVEVTLNRMVFEGRIVSLVLATDITERKKLEDQFRHAQKMEAVGRLAGGVAHDFNNILTAIIGYGSLAQIKLKEGDPLRHHLDEVIAAANRGAGLTQSLLAFSRKQIMDPRPVNLNTIIGRVGKLLVRLIGEDVKLVTKLTADDLTVVADSGQIEQVLMNLATNARDSMPEGGVLNIETGRVVLDERFTAVHNYGQPGTYAVFSMTDTGTGMDAATVERIFEPFFTTKELGHGTGLGLSMVYGIVKQHDGYINVYSEPGRGTTFKIYLPLAAEAAAEDKPQQEQALLPQGTETVLVAEDDEPLRRLARSVLQEFGYSVIEAVDGEDALDKVRTHGASLKLLILDVIMPKKNGKEVYEEAKKLVPGVKALFTSGYTADIVYKKGIVEQGQAFISKPVSPADLLKKVREVLDR